MAVKNIVIDLSKYNDNDYNDYQTENLENSVNIQNDPIPTIESLIQCGSVDVQAAYGAPEAPLGCGPTKYSGNTINLASTPDGGIGPYTVRFWRKAGGAAGIYSLVGTTKYSVTEATTVTESIVLNDFDVSSATGDTIAGVPISDTVGIITDPFGGGAPLAPAKIRVATTVADLCPSGSQICISYCDVTLGCVAPTCNFTVI
jgi:hypothetical protein